ncbi:MAG: YqeG family HAD IIIA-type phosphatase [Oscillospiraceae bacterium]|jgi:HAD superfamily phosphatase (TIGR01668 family)|nr:YqeG family HAD IIIA-type phosphatase [Oscillospiraceae bacterium]
MRLKPDLIVDNVYDLTAEQLRSRGITLLLADLDNTLVPYGGEPSTAELMDWKRELARGGVELFMVSNTKQARADEIAESLGIGFVKNARKPGRRGILEALRICGRSVKETALVGDQVFTDVLGANRCGLTSIRVRPISLANPLFRIRYWLELCILLLINGKTFDNARPKRG